MQSAAIKRKALFHNSELRMSANNVRDLMKHLLEKKIVRRIKMKKKAHPRYELTDLGKVFRELLLETKAF